MRLDDLVKYQHYPVMPAQNSSSPHTRYSRKSFFPQAGLPLYVMQTPVQRSLPFHSHDFTELVIVTKGEGMHVTGEEEYPIREGDVFVIHMDQPHSYKDVQDMEVINVLFDAGHFFGGDTDLGELPGFHALITLEPVLRQKHGLRYRLSLSAHDLAVAKGLAEAIQRELTCKAGGYRSMAGALMLQLAGFLARSYSRVRDPEPRAMMRLGKVLAHMESHCQESIPLARLAHIAGMSQSTLLRAFRRVMKRSPIDHLIRLRVQHACAKLTDGESSITEIALATGFSDSNYFSRQFRRITGMSPRQYQQQNTRT